MKQFLIILFFFCGAAQAQQIDYTVTNPTYIGLENIIQQNATPTNLGDDGTVTGINIGFSFEFYGEEFSSINLSSNGLISFKNNINGCCSGELLPSNSYYDFGIFGIWTDLVNIGTANPYYKTLGEEGDRRFVVGWYNQAMYYDSNQRSSFEITLFESSNNILLNYDDINLNRTFTAGIQGYGSQDQFKLIYFGSNGNTLDYTSWLFNYGSTVSPPPPDYIWTIIAGENQSFQLLTETNVRYGASGIYTTLTLGPGTYSCSNNLFGDPVPGVVKQCEIGEIASEEPPVVNCVLNPSDPTCVINSIINEEPIYFVEDTSSPLQIDNQEELTVDDLFAMTNSMTEQLESEKPLEELLSDNNQQQLAAEERIALMADEQKLASLEDAIDKNVLEAVLSVALDAALATTTIESTTEQSSSTRRETLSASSVESTATDTSSSSVNMDMQKEESFSETESLAALDILETGRQLGQEALATTMASVEASANESMNEAQTVAAVSSNESVEQSAFSFVAQVELPESSIDTDNTQQSFEQSLNEVEMLIAEQTQFNTIAEQESFDTVQEQVFVAQAEQQFEQLIDDNINETQEAQSAIESTTFEQAVEMFANNIDSINEEQNELENFILQQSIDQSQLSDDDNRMSFAEAEAVTIASDPALANAFNLQPNTASLELLGVLGSRAEEKSDAELRAEQVVAANKEEQDAINANYMEADQSGILAAIGSDTDVTAYRSAMLNDNNIWYRPEDIYKNIVIRDNVRGMYFLEKGSTDTYKQMIDDQYK